MLYNSLRRPSVPSIICFIQNGMLGTGKVTLLSLNKGNSVNLQNAQQRSYQLFYAAREQLFYAARERTAAGFTTLIILVLFM